MAEAVDDGRTYGEESQFSSNSEHGISDQIIDSWCDLCYDVSSLLVEADGFCPECNCFVCKPCADAHKKVPLLRNHKILRGKRMPKYQADKPVRYLECATHDGNVNGQFCLDHGTMLCAECVKQSHHHCKTTAIHNLCKDIKHADFNLFKNDVNVMMQTVVSTKATLENNMSDIEEQRKNMIKEAESVRDAIISVTRDICSDTIRTITEHCRQKTSDIADNVSSLTDVVHSLDETKSDIDKTLQLTFGPNQFIRLQEIVDSIRRLQDEIDEMYKQLYTIQLSFCSAPEISEVFSLCKQLGHVKDTISQTTDIKQMVPEIIFPKPFELKATDETEGNGNEISKLYVIKLKTLCIKTQDDSRTCNITGMDVTRSGILLVADGNNQKIKSFSPTNQLLSSFPLPNSPKGITLIDDTTAAVSTIGQTISFLDISDPTRPLVQNIAHLGYAVSGMTSCNANLVVIQPYDSPCVKMIDLKGRDLWTASTHQKKTFLGLKLSQKLFKSPEAIATKIVDNKTTIVVTDWERDTITFLDGSNGDLIRIIAKKGGGPQGITTDAEGKVYISYLCGKKVDVWSSDLQDCKTWLLDRAPGHIIYDNTAGELIVSYDKTDMIDRFQFS